MMATPRFAVPSRITVGLSSLGRGTLPGSREEASAVDFAEELLTADIAYVDTSNNYAEGRSEAVLGVAARRVGPSRTTKIISKVDIDPVTARFDRERVLRSFEESCMRLGVDRLPLVHLHDPDMLTMAESLGPGGAVEGMLELRSSGVVDAIGVAAGSLPMMRAYVDTEVFDAVLCHNRFTLVDQSASSLFEEAKRQGMTVFNAAPFGAGLLSTGAHPGAHYAYMPASDSLLAWVRAVEAICREYDVTLPAVALHYSLRSALVDSTVVGVSSSSRLASLVELTKVEIPVELWADLATLGPAPSPIDDPPAR
ncbi:aldo/keto reductase [Microbacterium sp. Mcb102]|uniref:aldo/keto reductase n=1 Tax=Microbacterium sp. Mcb102 TaxID=2926012 RepID=UPI0021CA72D1|nr:aldo/keto reductase [Microbacterium sp. Mcb102]